MRKGLTLLICLAVVSSAMGGINYRENWDSYAAGTGDPTYQSVWPTVSGKTRFNLIAGSNPSSAPNAIEFPGSPADRGVTNNLADGITNGQAIAEEMGIGQWVVGGAGADLLSAGAYMRPGAGNQRVNFTGYFEISMGDVHAPTDLTTVLSEPIPVLAFGMLNGYPTATGTASTTGVYFFNGTQWITTTAVAMASSGYSRFVMDIDNTSNVTLRELGQSLSAVRQRTYMGGFDRITVFANNLKSPTGNNRIDDVYLTGGIIVPEPAALVLLGIGLPILLRRRRA